MIKARSLQCGFSFGRETPKFWFEFCRGIFWWIFSSACRPAAKGVQQKEFGKKVAKQVTEASERVTKKGPKESRKRKEVIELFLPTSFCGTLVDFFGLFFPRNKARKKSTKKSPAKFTQDFVGKNFPRISAEAFSWAPSTPKFLQYKKKFLRGIIFVKKYKKYLPAHAAPRGAHGSYKKIGGRNEFP